MRKIAMVVALLAAASPLPALAQGADESSLAEMAETMNDPQSQAAMGEVAAALVAMVMQMPVGPLAEAVSQMPGAEDMPPVDPDAQVRDLVGPEADEAPALVQRELPRMMGAMGAMAGALDAMLPQLRAMAESLPRAYPPSR